MMIRNFLYRVAEYGREYSDRIIKWALIAVSALLVILLLYGFIENVVRSRSDKRINELEQQYQQRDAEAKEAQARADAKAKEIEAKDAEIGQLEARAFAAELALKRTRRNLEPLKGNYETARDTPVDLAPDLSCDDVCARLAELGHPCR